jgi:hypothetical protein
MRLLVAAMMTLATAAVADPLPQPMPPQGGSCPHGYTTSNGFCVPAQGAQDAIPQRNGSCPWGWTSSGSFCLRSGR